MLERVILIVLDSVGIGALPDAEFYGDTMANTLGNIAKEVEGFSLPNLEALGLGSIDGMKNFIICENPEGAYGRCKEISVGKDTVTGHFEIAGIIHKTPFSDESDKLTTDITDKNMLEYINEAGMPVVAVGRISNIFTENGITEAIKTVDNDDGVEKTIEAMKKYKSGLIFSNLVDFEIKYGHRNDTEGYAKALEKFDDELPMIKDAMDEDDILIITADHGCDPTTKGTDHSREYVPILVYGKQVKENVNLGTRNGMCDIGKTVLDLLGVKNQLAGESFKECLF